MAWRTLAFWLAALTLGALAWRRSQWPGVLALASALVLWLLLNYTRMMWVLRRAARQPMGWVPSAVMFNARLQAGWPLWRVIAFTGSLGQALESANAEEDVFCWSDDGGSAVACHFVRGRLAHWRMTRPAQLGKA
ncbi:MAG: glycerate kinase [Burkholderiaceae bacterium]|jgi:hypothetical protein|nr:glycerate kinase [Burkholderiaceae bacterium]